LIHNLALGFDCSVLASRQQEKLASINVSNFIHLAPQRDVLLVINYLNRTRGGAEGEGLQFDSSAHDPEPDANATFDALQTSEWFEDVLESAKAKLSRKRLPF
jgi:hypothetical protein